MRRISIGKLILIVMIGIPVLVVAYTIVISRIELDRKSAACTINLPGALVFNTSERRPMMYTAVGGSRELSLQRGQLYSSQVWLGFSSFFGGVLILNRLAGNSVADTYAVLHVDSARRICEVSPPLELGAQHTDWTLIGNKAYRIDIRGGSLRLMRRMLGRTDVEHIVCETTALPISVDNLDRISILSIAADRLVFSVSRNVLVLNMRKKTVDYIGSGSDPIFCSRHILAFIPESSDANRVYLRTYDFRTGKIADVNVWVAQGWHRLPVLLPMVPHCRPERIRSISTIPGSSLLLVEVTRLGYGNSYLFLVDISHRTSCQLPIDLGRGQWSWAPAGELGRYLKVGDVEPEYE